MSVNFQWMDTRYSSSLVTVVAVGDGGGSPYSDNRGRGDLLFRFFSVSMVFIEVDGLARGYQGDRY